MSTTNTSFSTLITAIDTKAQSLASSTTDAKDLVYLGKAIEALNIPDTVSAVIDEGDTQVSAVTTAGTTQVSAVNTAGATQVAAVNAASAGYAPLADPTFTGTVNAAALTLSGNLTVNGTTTTVNSTTLDVADLNITIADGAADAAAANGAGLTVDGAAATMLYTSATDTWDFNKAITGTYTNLQPVVVTANVTSSQVIDMTKPMHHFDMTGGTAFSGVSIAAGRTSMMVLDTTATPHTPTWGSDIKWPGATEPTWADSRYWIVSMTCLDGSIILASASGYTV
jgi:hypothetical protein